MRPDARQQAQPPAGRVVAIDLLRGVAIAWVVLYHIWTDVRYPNVYPSQPDAFHAVASRLGDGNLAGMLLAIGNATLRVGYLGVPLFMMLSGLSLTMSAMRRPPSRPAWRAFMTRRARRVMAPYWFGFAATVAFALALALAQWQRHGGASYAHYVVHGDIALNAGQLTAGALLVPRILRQEWQFAPEGSLWFVIVIVQYYLLFPLLFAALKRYGPALLAATSLAVTLASLAAMIAVSGDLTAHANWVEMAAPFRVFEFAAGMSIGYVLARRPDGARLWTPPLAGVAMAAAGVAIFVAACMIEPDARMFTAIQGPAIVAAFALIILPLLAIPAGSAFERVEPVRWIAAIGVVSYTVLIISEPLRSITHTMSAEHVSDGWIAGWVLAGQIPLTLLLARPLARLLGLIESPGPTLTVGDLVGDGATAPGGVTGTRANP